MKNERKVAIGGADFVQFVPTDELVDYPVERVRRNPARLKTGQGVPPTRRPRSRPRARRGGEWNFEGMELYDGFEGLLVRTMLLRSSRFEEIKRLPKIRSSNDVAKLCRHLGLMDREHMVVLCLNPQNDVVAIHENAIGLISRAETTPNLVLKAPILSNAAAMILVHNHPGGGMAWPSPDDIKMANSLRDVARCVGIQLLDSVIVTDQGHYSLAEAKDM